MKRALRRAVAVATMCWVAGVSAQAGGMPALMPLPVAVAPGDGHLPFTGTLLPHWAGCDGHELQRAADRLQADVRRLTGVPPDGDHPVPMQISCAIDGALVPDRHEGYRLNVSAEGVRIDAEGPAGVLRAFATLRQLVVLGSGQPVIPRVSIDDAPRFGWRGLMLDVARHFLTVTTIERQIDAMERMKLNVLHLHLSDNEAFRVESRRFPELNRVSSQGGYYRQQDVRHLVAYAADRGVRIVPEFDVPGHSRAMVEALPEIGVQVTTFRPPFPPDVALNPAAAETYRFLEGLIAEMAPLFPGPYFHIGGDEVSDAVWAESADVEALMERENLATKAAVQGHFARRVIAMVRAAGKTAMGWEEVAAGDVPDSVVIQAWRTSNATAAATARGHAVVVSAGYYLDLLMPAAFHYEKDPLDPSAAGFTPDQAQRARARHPMVAQALTDELVARPLPPLDAGQQALVLGGEAPLWGELVTDEMVDHRLWPRAAALAERFWSPATVRDVDDMYRRLGPVHDRLTLMGLSGDANRRRMAMRLSPGAAEPVHVLLEVVTPVRNMAHDHRILAALRGRRLVQPLNALADAAPADSLAARRFQALARRFVAGEHELAAPLESLLTLWRENHARFAEVASGNAMLEDALPVSRAIADLADIGLQSLDAVAGDIRLDDSVAAGAEQVLAVAEQQEAASSLPLLSFLEPQPPADLIIAITPGIRALFAAATNSHR